MKPAINYINPDGLSKNPAFSQLVTTEGAGKTIYIGGQDAVNANSEIVGKGDLTAQTVQVMENIKQALESAGAGFENLIKLTIIIKQGEDITKGFEASQKYLGGLKHPPAITGFFTAALAHPDYLVEVEAIAFVAG